MFRLRSIGNAGTDKTLTYVLAFETPLSRTTKSTRVEFVNNRRVSIMEDQKSNMSHIQTTSSCVQELRGNNRIGRLEMEHVAE